jgi:hypothetical protein
MPLAEKLLLLSSAALVLLAVILLMRGGMMRVAALKDGEVRWEEIALDNDRFAVDIRQWANAFNNQFQLPVLFHVLVAFLVATGLADMISAVLALVFVAARYAHAFVHVTSNHVPTRGAVFMVGASALSILWIWFVIRVVAA